MIYEYLFALSIRIYLTGCQTSCQIVRQVFYLPARNMQSNPVHQHDDDDDDAGHVPLLPIQQQLELHDARGRAAHNQRAKPRKGA